jgi:chromosome segregation ATPase
MSDFGGSTVVQISIALIGLLASLGWAYITTGAEFKSQLTRNQSAVTALGDSINIVTNRVAGQLTQAEKSIKQLGTARDSLTSVTNAIALQLQQARESIDQLKIALTASQQQNAQIQSQLAVVEQRLNSANSGVTALAANVSALSNRAAKLNTLVPQPK